MRSEKQGTSDHDTYTDAIAPRGALQWKEGKMQLSGKTRVRVSNWGHKLILQVQTQRTQIYIDHYSDGHVGEREEYKYAWRDATIEDLQEIGIIAVPEVSSVKDGLKLIMSNPPKSV